MDGENDGKFMMNIELDDGKFYRKALYLMVKTMVSCRFPLNQSNDLPKFKSNLGPDDPPARRTPRPPEDLRPDFGSGLVRTSGIFPQSLSLSVSEPWATPNRATPKSCYPFKK